MGLCLYNFTEGSNRFVFDQKTVNCERKAIIRNYGELTPLTEESLHEAQLDDKLGMVAQYKKGPLNKTYVTTTQSSFLL